MPPSSGPMPSSLSTLHLLQRADRIPRFSPSLLSCLTNSSHFLCYLGIQCILTEVSSLGHLLTNHLVASKTPLPLSEAFEDGHFVLSGAAEASLALEAYLLNCIYCCLCGTKTSFNKVPIWRIINLTPHFLSKYPTLMRFKSLSTAKKLLTKWRASLQDGRTFLLLHLKKIHLEYSKN